MYDVCFTSIKKLHLCWTTFIFSVEVNFYLISHHTLTATNFSASLHLFKLRVAMWVTSFVVSPLGDTIDRRSFGAGDTGAATRTPYECPSPAFCSNGGFGCKDDTTFDFDIAEMGSSDKKSS